MMVEESLASEPPIGMSLPPADLYKILGGNLARLTGVVESARLDAR